MSEAYLTDLDRELLGELPTQEYDALAHTKEEDDEGNEKILAAITDAAAEPAVVEGVGAGYDEVCCVHARQYCDRAY